MKEGARGRKEGRNEGRKVFELLSCIACMPEWTWDREQGAIWRVVEEKMRVEPEGGEERERETEREGLMMNGWRTGMRGGAAWKSIYGARSRSEDDETLIKVNELPELPANPLSHSVRRQKEGERRREGGGWKFDWTGEKLDNPAVALVQGWLMSPFQAQVVMRLHERPHAAIISGSYKCLACAHFFGHTFMIIFQN